MKYFVASFGIVVLIGGCAYEPGEWYGIHNAVPDHSPSKHAESVESAHPSVAGMSHERTSSMKAQ